MSEKNKNHAPEESKATEKPQPPREEKPKAPEMPKDAPPTKPERPKECVSCGKNIQKQWYYREGGYYCGKGCWKKSKKKAPEKSGP